MAKLEEITCPHCKKDNTWRNDNPFRPFCSERCKLIDLGDWAEEQHRIPSDPAHPDQMPTSDKDDEK